MIPGTIHVIGDSAINNSTVDGEGGPTDSGTPGAMTVACGVTLTLDNTTLEDLHVTNHGTLQVDGTDTLTLNTVQIDGGTINNFTDSGDIVAGNIEITGDSTFGDLAVEKGNLTIDDSTALKTADDTTVTFDGVHVTDNGALDIGDFHSDSGAILTLDDDTNVTGSGTMTINAGSTLDVDCGTTTINLCGTITNHGTLEASCGGTLDIVSHVDNACGSLLATSGGVLDIESAICGGTATIHAATLEFDAASNVNVTFDNGDGGTDYGLLILKDPVDFSGTISGFHGTCPDAADSDEIELAGFVKTSCSIQDCGDNQILTLTDANGHVVTLKFVNFDDTLVVKTDGDNTYIYDPPVGGAKDPPATAAATPSNEHVTAPAHQNGTDHAPSPTNEAAFGSEQLSAVTVNSHNGGDATAATNPLASPPGTLALGSGQLAGWANEAAFTGDHAAILPAMDMADANAGGLTQSLLSSLLKVLNGGASAASVDTVAPGGEHLTDSTIVDGSGAVHDEIAPAKVLTAPASEHAVAPATVTPPATSPTLASASLGGLGNDSFAFHPNLGSDSAQTTDVHASELALGTVQFGGPALGSIAPEFHQEFAFDAIHQDAASIGAIVDQFHQMATNSTLLH